MREDIHLHMKIGIVHESAFPAACTTPGGILESVMHIVCDHFFDAIEITSIPDSDERRQVGEMLLSGGLLVCFHAKPQASKTNADLGSVVGHERHLAVEMMKEAVDEAYEMNAEVFTISHDFLSKASFNESNYQVFTESLKEISNYSASKGTMKLAREPLFYTNKKTLAEHQFGIFIDLEHLPVNYEISEQNIKNIRKSMVYSRVGNCCKEGRYERIQTKPPENGNRLNAVSAAHLAKMLRNLYKIGYIGEDSKRGLISLNVKPLNSECPHAVIANGKRTLLEAWRMSELDQTIWPNC